MKKIIWSFIIGFLTLQWLSYAATSTEAFEWAFDVWVLTSYRTESLKTAYLTREMAAPLLVNYINNVARKGYSGNLCKANDIEVAEKIYQDDLRTLCNFWILRWSNNKISPKRTLSKQEAIALVMRIIDGEQKEKTQGHRAYHYYERAKELWYYGVPDITNDKNPLITLEEFIDFLYSTEYPYETISKTKNNINYTTGGSFKTSDDALLKLLEIIKNY